ncbi:TetR family transcriptional regulator [Spongisporangium articulatum]|uniref:TetR family transcriptional regulator n=1 Tax=Spongisporangium articulatum TaxID=3362603 RepID=A0ABW8ATT5_9ACTN
MTAPTPRGNTAGAAAVVAPRAGYGTGQTGGSRAQRDRRERMQEAATMLATQGGYDAVTMRAVAENADVALGTLYRYFPSKNHLLVSSLVSEFARAQVELDRIEIPGDGPTERMLFVLARVTRMFQRYPSYTEAMTRAFIFADDTAKDEVDSVARQMERMFAGAMDPDGEITEENVAIARVLGDVWLANLVSWVTQRISAEGVAERLELTVHLLLDHTVPAGR